MTIHQFSPGTPLDAVRANIAKELANFYAELAGTAQKPQPRFSLARVVRCVAGGHGLRDGYEREICSGAAIATGEQYDPHHPTIPWLALRDLTAGAASAGGYLRGTDTLSTVVDVLRPWSVVAKAGVTVLENLRANVTIPRVSTAATGNWISDEAGTGLSESTPVVGEVALAPKTFIGLVEYSRLFRLQAPSYEEFVRTQLLRAAASALDKAVLAGAGGAEPVGLLSVTGTGTQSGSTLGWAGVLNMIETAATAGADDSKLTFVTTPAVREILAQREVVSTAGRFVWDGDSVAGKPGYVTTDITAATAICGDFSQAVVGLWGPGLRIDVNREHGFPTGIEAIRVLMAADLAVPLAGAFCKSTSIT